MEKELKNLRDAMNSTTHRGTHFSEIQKRKIRAALQNQDHQVIKKSNFPMYIVATLAACLFLLLSFTGLFDNQASNHLGNEPISESDWFVRHDFSKDGQEMFSVFPDPYLSANKPYGYLFSFKESFDAYQGKEIEIVAVHHETGKRINVVPAEKITDPSSGYSSLKRYVVTFSLPIEGLWKYEIYLDKKLYGDVVLSVGEETFLPPNIPSFVQTSDFEKVDWERKAVDLGHNIIGNANKSGVIGADMPSVNIGQKWMWHLWGDENFDPFELTVVGFHRETETVHQLLTIGWTIELGGENNGADAHIPSSVNIPEPGEWAILLYVDGEFFDILIYDINS